MASDIIRPLREQDRPALAALMRDPGVCWGTHSLPYESPRRFYSYLNNRQEGVHLVAEVAGEPVGHAVLTPDKGRRAHVGNIALAVADSHSGQGLGSALLGALLDCTDRWLGLKRLELTVFADNYRAIALYERHGFVRECLYLAHTFRGGRYIDALGMARLA